MFERQPFGHLAGALVGLACAVGSANAQQLAGCGELPNHAALTAALDKATAEEMSGLNNQMWATLVDRDGVVCAVAFSGANRAAQWPWSRVISAQKASTANAFSLDSSSNSDGSGQATGLALSTANLYAAVQPGGSLYGLQFRNPVDTDVAYRGPHGRHGTPMDPMVGNREGGVNVFGGGLPLYNSGGTLVGALGVSGNTSCTDHIIAWKVRDAVKFDTLPGGVSPTKDDNIIHDISGDSKTGHSTSAGGWGHPECDAAAAGIANELPSTHPVSKAAPDR